MEGKRIVMSDRCDQDVFKTGLGICCFDAPAKIAEPWVQKVATESGQKVDWHYSGGVVNVLYIGDYDKVLAVVERLRPELDKTRQAYNKKAYGLDIPGGFRIFPKEAHGLHRQGDPLPDDVVGVDSTSSL